MCGGDRRPLYGDVVCVEPAVMAGYGYDHRFYGRRDDPVFLFIFSYFWTWERYDQGIAALYIGIVFANGAECRIAGIIPDNDHAGLARTDIDNGITGGIQLSGLQILGVQITHSRLYR